jgi:hypothetical protein
MAEKRRLTEWIVRDVYYKFYSRNLMFELQVRARDESVDYINKYMHGALTFESHESLLRYCIERAAKGEILEFGVMSGATIRFIAKTSGQTVHGFDSFEGLPEDWTGHREIKGAFGRGGKLPRVPANVVLHKGWFKDTIDAWLDSHPGKIGFIHMDCDLYSSTRDVLWPLKDRLQVGTIIKFDEYFNYPGWRDHEAKAWKEFVEEFKVEYRYLAFTARDGSVAVEITKV